MTNLDPDRQLVLPNSYQNEEYMDGVEPLWCEVMKTAVVIAKDFYIWMKDMLSSPINYLLEDIDSVLFPNTSINCTNDDNLCEDKVVSFNDIKTEFNNKGKYTHKQSNNSNQYCLSNNFFENDTRENPYELQKKNTTNASKEIVFIEPEKDKPDIGAETECYAYRSHVLLTIHRVENIKKIIESSVSYGDFKLKGPGFRLENIRIPLRKGGNQIISIRFVTHDMKEDKKNPNSYLNSVSEYLVEIPISLMKEKVSRKWVVLSRNGELYRSYEAQDIMPEALYLMQSDENNVRSNEPRINFSFWKCMQGLMEFVVGSKKSGNLKRIYVGYLEDPIDLAVSKAVNEHPDILKKALIERGKNSGEYFIDGTFCILTLEVDNKLIVHEGGAKQPLLDYLSGSTNNIVWDEIEPVCAIDLVNPSLLPNLSRASEKWVDMLSRSDAMSLACHRAAIREHYAIEYLKMNGIDAPPSMYTQYLNPVSIRIFQNENERLMTYTWDDGFTNARLVEVDSSSGLMYPRLIELDSNSNFNITSIPTSNNPFIKSEEFVSTSPYLEINNNNKICILDESTIKENTNNIMSNINSNNISQSINSNDAKQIHRYKSKNIGCMEVIQNNSPVIDITESIRNDTQENLTKINSDIINQNSQIMQDAIRNEEFSFYPDQELQFNNQYSQMNSTYPTQTNNYKNFITNPNSILSNPLQTLSSTMNSNNIQKNKNPNQQFIDSYDSNLISQPYVYSENGIYNSPTKQIIYNSQKYPTASYMQGHPIYSRLPTESSMIYAMTNYEGKYDQFVNGIQNLTQ